MIRYIYILIIGFLAFSTVAEAQEQKGYRQRAEQFFNSGAYARAAEVYERLTDVRRPRVLDVERIGESYLLISQYELAENWLSRAYHMEGHGEQTVLNYAEALKQNGKYIEAKKVLTSYQSDYGDSERLQIELAGCDSAIRWMASPLAYNIVNERNVNTDLSEFGLFPTSAGAVYAGEPKVYTGEKSAMTGQAYLKIFSADMQSEGLTGQSVMGDVFNEAEYHVGPIITNREENVLYITRTYPGKDTERLKEKNMRFDKHNLELKIYRQTATGWEEEDFPYNNVREYSLGHAALSEDEQTLYFASDMPGGHGGVDIWYSELQSDGSWGEPQNAGTEINSAGDDMFPTVFEDRLYYSSNGFAGMGGLDIYVAQGEKQHFSERRNLQYPINSASDDFCFVVVQDNEEAVRGFLSSNRVGGVGGDDIYSFGYAKPKIIITLEGLTLHKESREVLENTNVTLYDGDRAIVSRKLSDLQGEFSFILDKNKNYRVLAEREGFHADSVYIEGVNPIRDTTLSVTLLLQPVMTIGDRFVLENIYYDFDKHNIRKDAAEILDQLVRTMRDNPTLRIELSSHTDSRGSDSYNMRLSQRRADSAVDYLVSRGIARDRLVAKGYGESRLVNHCSNGVPCSIAEHQANRRTEVEVLAY